MFLAFSLHEAVNSFYGRLNAAVNRRHLVTLRSLSLPENCNAIITVPGGKHSQRESTANRRIRRVCLLQVYENDCFLGFNFCSCLLLSHSKRSFYPCLTYHHLKKDQVSGHCTRVIKNLEICS